MSNENQNHSNDNRGNLPMLTFKGEIAGIKTKTYEGNTTTHYQFLMDNGDNGLELMSVKITNQKYLGKNKGDKVELPVLFSCVEGNVYFRTVE